MERLTMRSEENDMALIKTGTGYHPICFVCPKLGFCWKCYEEEAIEKLAKYEDAEEQGILLKVPPCRVGDTAYVIDKDSRTGKLSIFAGKWDVVSFRVLKNGEIDVHGEVSYEIPDIFTDGNKTMSACMYVGQNGTKFGEVVFLTHKAAKQKLKELSK
jgi:hypothetical protein